MRPRCQARPGLDLVDPVVPVDEALVAVATNQRVVAAPAPDRVDSVATIQMVVVTRVIGFGLAVVTLQDVIVGRPEENVVPLATNYSIWSPIPFPFLSVTSESGLLMTACQAIFRKIASNSALTDLCLGLPLISSGDFL